LFCHIFYYILVLLTVIQIEKNKKKVMRRFVHFVVVDDGDESFALVELSEGSYNKNNDVRFLFLVCFCIHSQPL